MSPRIASAFCISHTFLSLDTQRYLFPFVVSQALPWAFGYYGNSVAIGLSTLRRSRICVHETFSPFRCPVRLLAPFINGSSSQRAFWRVGPFALLRCHRFRYATVDGYFITGDWGSASLGFTSISCETSCGQDSQVPLHYIPSCFPAFLPCSFPLCLSTPGWVGVLSAITQSFRK
jgi:hypothetical protein